MIDKSIALNKLRSKNKFSIDFHSKQKVSSKKTIGFWRELNQVQDFVVIITPPCGICMLRKERNGFCNCTSIFAKRLCKNINAALK